MYLIVGANGFIGNKVYWSLKASGLAVKGTYFPDQGSMAGADALYLDLEEPDFEQIMRLNDVKAVILCHGVSSLDLCKQQPERTRRINVDNTLRLMQCFDPRLVKIVFLSTSLVYAGDKANPSELDDPHPNTEYGFQKLAVEKFIEGNFPAALTLRLTKIIGIERGDNTLFTSWLDRMLAGQKLRLAVDSYISPVYVVDLIRYMRTLLDRDASGCFNLGGEHVDTLAIWGDRLAKGFGFANQIEKVRIADLGLLENRPKYNSVDSGKLWGTIGADSTLMETWFKLLADNYDTRMATI